MFVNDNFANKVTNQFLIIYYLAKGYFLDFLYMIFYYSIMYYFISGIVDCFEEGRLVVDCNGVGYDLCVSNNTLSQYAKVGEKVKIYTYLAVSEDDMRLFGFYSIQEKAMFERLISVSGIGPKLSMQILSGMDINTLVTCIVSGDIALLSKIKGLGKKTAERIVLELREKLGSIGNDNLNLVNVVISNNNDKISQEAIMALESFGVAKANATKLVSEARKQTDKLENIITIALRSMDK